MIRTLRNSGIGQFFLGLIVVAIILAFVLTGAAPTAGGGDDECVARVGEDTCIGPKEFEASYRLLSAIGGGSINEAAAKRLRLREQVARGLAEREVLVKEAKKLQIGTSEDDVDQELLEGRTRISLPAEGAEQLAMSLAMCVNGPSGCEPGTIGLRAIDVKKDGKFDIDLYKRTIRVWTRRSPNHFKEMQVQEQTAERMRQLIKSQVRVSEQEAFLAYSRVKSKATARSVHAQSDWFERYLIEPTDEQLAVYHTEHKTDVEAAVAKMAEGWKAGCKVVSEIRIGSSDPGSEDAEEKRKKAEELKRKLMSGADFYELARQHSNAETARLGGRLGCLDEGYGAGAAVLIEAAKKLTKPGELAGLVETIRGFTILRLEAVVSEENREELKQKHAAFKLLSAQMGSESAKKFALDLISAAQNAELETATRQLVHERLGLAWDEGKDLTDQGEHPALDDPKAPQVEISRAVSMDQDAVPEVKTEEAATFKLFELEKDDDLVEVPLESEGGFVVLQLKSKEALTKESFEEDRARVMQTIWKRKAEQALSRYVDRLLNQAGGISFNPKFIPPEGADDAEEDS